MLRFRAWHKKNKRMYCVWGVKWSYENYEEDADLKVDRVRLIFMKHPYEREVNFSSIILEQYTGFKDKNRVRIYDGDLLLAHWGGYNARGDGDYVKRGAKVNWNQYTGSWFLDSHPFYEWDFAEVIGNIHQNNDLLEVE